MPKNLHISGITLVLQIQFRGFPQVADRLINGRPLADRANLRTIGHKQISLFVKHGGQRSSHGLLL